MISVAEFDCFDLVYMLKENSKFTPFLVKFTPFLRFVVKKRGRPAGSKNKTSTTRV
jgi:hypothetical protein